MIPVRPAEGVREAQPRLTFPRLARRRLDTWTSISAYLTVMSSPTRSRIHSLIIAVFGGERSAVVDDTLTSRDELKGALHGSKEG